MNPIKLIGRASLFALLAACGLQAQARATHVEASQSVGLTSAVQGGSKTTYFDLLRQLFPDLKADATAHETIPLRSISEPGKSEAITGDLSFDFEPHWLNSGGKRLLLLRVCLKGDGVNEATPYEGEGFVLAVFSLEPGAKLLDALDVKTDRLTGFWDDRPVFRLDARNDALVVYSTHWNAGESFLSLEMLFVDAGRFKTITSLFLYETQGCGVTYTERPEFRAVADAGSKYPKVLVRVKLTKGPDGAGCEHPSRGYTRFYQGLYRWNTSKRRYESASRRLDILDKLNKKRLSD